MIIAISGHLRGLEMELEASLLSLRGHPIDSMKHGSAAGGIASRQTTLRAGRREGVGELAGERVGGRRFVDLASVSARAEPPRPCAVVPLCGGRVPAPLKVRAQVSALPWHGWPAVCLPLAHRRVAPTTGGQR